MQLRRFPLRLAGLALALLAAFAVVAFHEWSHQQALAALNRIDTAARIRTTLRQVVGQLLAMESASHSYLLSGDPRQVAQFEQAAGALEAQLKDLRQLALLDQGPEAEAVERLEGDLRRHLVQADFAIHLQARDDAPAWQALVANEEGRRRLDAIQRQIEGLFTAAGVLREASRQEVDQALGLSHAGIPLAMVAALLAGVFYWRQLRARAQAREQVEAALRQERDRLDALVRERTASLSALANHLQQVREDERGRLANELHDELGALLTAARLDVARLSRRLPASAADATELLDHLQHLLGEGIALKRRIIEDLRPSSLATLGLAPALEILAREFGERSGLDVAIEADAPTLGEAAQLTVFRLVQEALTNVARHAHARRVDVVLRPLPGQLEVSVADDGRGFKPGAPGLAHHGLVGMRHRVEAAGGQLEVISRPGRGTRVRATLPLPATPPEAQDAAVPASRMPWAAGRPADLPGPSVPADEPSATSPTRSASTTV